MGERAQRVTHRSLRNGGLWRFAPNPPYASLLEKQKEGKKRMRQFGKVDIPQEAFIAALKVDV